MEVCMQDIYEKLRARLDMFPQGFPSTQSRVEIEILEQLFSQYEAEIALHLKPFPEPPANVAERMGVDAVELSKTLYDMSKRGLILRVRILEDVYYSLIPWMVGMWEFQLNNLNQENIRLYERYYHEGVVPYKKQAILSGARVIPIEEEVHAFKEIQPYEKVSEIISSHTKFAVADCICRKESSMLGHDCGKLREACLMFGPAAEYYIENELGREITREEAMDVLKKAEQDGLVHVSSNHTGVKGFICNCCGCCCKALLFITEHNHLNAVTKSNYYAVVDADKCSACEVCIERCQVHAVTGNEEGITLERDRCIGCGLCVSTCPTSALSMVNKEPHETTRIFQDTFEALQEIGKTWDKSFPFE
jgi:Na+-translocating ferredoxin:NAD+ oxidoreductase subunit B